MMTPLPGWERRGQGGRRRLELLLVPLLLLSCSGCFALAVGGAAGAAGAVYVLGRLTDEVNHDVPVVHRAAERAMKDLGLQLSENKADKLSAHMESEFSDGANVWIDMKSLAGQRTKLVIRVGVTGDEVRARQINEAIKRYLPQTT